MIMSKLKPQTPPTTESLPAEQLEEIIIKLFPVPAGSFSSSLGAPVTLEISNDVLLSISSKEIREALKGKKGRMNTTPGPNGLTKSIWRYVPDDLINVLAHFFEHCLSVGSFSDLWKIARLVLIPEARPLSTAIKYRPICLLDEDGKPLERIIAARFKDHMNSCARAALSDLQFGFKEGTGTVDALLLIRDYINSACTEGKFVIAISLNIQNAFNSLPFFPLLST